MAGFFNQNQGLSERAMLENRYRSSRIDLLLVAVMTLVNIIFVITGSDTYFLFSATVPYLLSFVSALYCGMLSPEVYEYLEIDPATAEFLPAPVFYVALAIALIFTALYVLAFFLSNKGRYGWLIFALVFFIIDTLIMFGYYGISFDMIIDLLFHIWVLYYLIAGISAAKRFKELPPEEPDKNEEVEGQDFYPEMVSIGSGKQVGRIAANYYRGKEAVGGWIYFYNDRVIFKSHTLNIQTGNTTILYSDMVSTGKYSNLGFIHNGLTITTQDGTVHKFVVNRRDSVIAHLDRQILRNNA